MPCKLTRSKPTRRERTVMWMLKETGSRLVVDALGGTIIAATGEQVSRRVTLGLCRGGWIYGGVGLAPPLDRENGRLSERGLAELQEAGR